METPAKQRAVQLIGPDELKLNTEKDVHQPNDYQVLAKVEAVGGGLLQGASGKGGFWFALALTGADLGNLKVSLLQVVEDGGDGRPIGEVNRLSFTRWS